MRGAAEPPSPTVGAASAVTVVGADEQQPGAARVDVDVDRWCRLATDVLRDEGRRGELTLTFVDRDEIAALNAEHMGKDGPTDVLSFPLDALDGDESAEHGRAGAARRRRGLPDVAREQAPDHAGTLDDELALLVVHGVLHVLGHDHAESGDTALMRAKELELLSAAPLERAGAGGLPPGPRRGRPMTGTDIWMLIAIFVILFVLAFLAVAETALNRISRRQGAGDRRLAGIEGRRSRCSGSSPTRSASSTRCS